MAFSGNSLLLDANLLLLLSVGSFDARLFGRRRLDIFLAEDLERLQELIDVPANWSTTPHLLAEVSNLADQCVPRRQHRDFRHFLQGFYTQFDERWVPAQELSSTEAFHRLGLADAALVRLADQRAVVLSTDLELCAVLWGRGIRAENFNRLRNVD